MKPYWKKSLAFLLALAMCLSLLPAAHVHAAGETGSGEATGEASASFEPWGHGYRFVDILNFDPASDPYSQELVASVPLQERNATFAATQANPDLSDDSKLYVISSGNYRSTDVNEAPWNAGMSYDEFSYNLFKFWQYADMVGAGGRPTQNIAIGSSEKEYGIIAIPMAAATNAAHKNGVITLAEYFIPRTPQYTEEWLYQDENGEFPYAKKLVELAKYYGFDGYFINQEASIDSSYVPLFREMLQYMREQGIYIQWYDSITEGGSVSYQNADVGHWWSRFGTSMDDFRAGVAQRLQKEEEPAMTREEVAQMISKALEEDRKSRIFPKLANVPGWAGATVQKLLERDALQAGKGEEALS